ncbi:STM3941 family protein [Flavobacterium terrae]|uniref:Uncharacterized protein n=1 Tax=Flavobacterium terrae TaxID=415425 RepID=A0A1M6HHE9_9FLAO|nr:STM3941 family protein [Flavobacterium terrae]SHJ21539.1 hypothetical protein SAMN05444363_0011 [Flavobacterium terrae]
MTELKLYKSNSKGLKILALCLPFVLIGFWMISEKQNGTFDYYMGWFITSFFGLGIPISIFTLFDNRPQIIINENGIWDRTTKQTEIKWEQIKESYLIDIYNQKFISIVVDETFVFKKNTFSKLNKLNKYIGAQELNLNLSQIKIDENKLTDFINTIRISEKSIRNNQIQNFNSSLTLNPVSNSQKYFTYLLILICMLVASLSNFYAFWVIMITMRIGGLIAKWYRGTDNNSNLRKYAERLAYLGFTNMVLIVLIFKTYDYATNKIGIKLTNKIETYKTEFGNYPNEIKTISENLNFNPIEKYIVSKIVYKKTEKEYILELKFLNHNLKEFDTELNEWN